MIAPADTAFDDRTLTRPDVVISPLSGLLILNDDDTGLPELLQPLGGLLDQAAHTVFNPIVSR